MNPDEKIEPAEVEFSPLSLADESGRLFFWRGRVLRAVSASAADEMRARFESGLVEALTRRGLIPAAALTGLRMEGYALVVEHTRMPVVSFPYEWSYGMLRAAAACVLEANEIANAHGWELKDCHGFNVLFDGALPRYVDLGSFMPRRAGACGWSAYEEFVRFYEYPLRIWRGGNSFVARGLLAMADNMPHESFLLYRHPCLRRWGGAATLGRMLCGWHRFRRLSGISDEKLRAFLSPRRAEVALWLKRQPWLPAQHVNLAALRTRILKRERRWLGSGWGRYQAGWNDAQPTRRFQRVLEIVDELKPGSVLELGGNQGWLGRQLLEKGIASQVVCTDSDEEAVDQAHAAAASRGVRQHTAVLDFVYPQASTFGLAPEARFAADTVLVLAVSHHVLLTQKVAVDRFLAAVRGFARRHVLVEFMPRGLWDGRVNPPVPAWYRTEWFREHFARHFRLVREEQLEENRVLFVGEVPGGRG